VFIRYPDSYRKVGDTLPCTLCMNIQWYAGVREDTMAAQLSASPGGARPSPGEATGWRGSAEIAGSGRHAPSGLSDPAGSATQRAGGLEKLALGGGG